MLQSVGGFQILATHVFVALAHICDLGKGFYFHTEAQM